MDMLNRLNLSKRILLGYLLPLVLLVGASVAVYWSAQGVRQAFDGVQKAQEIVLTAEAMQVEFVTLHRAARGYIIYKNERTKKHFEEAQRHMRENRAKLEQMVRDAQQKELLRNLDELGQRLGEQTDREIALVDAGETAKAVQMVQTGQGSALADDYDKAIDKFIQREMDLLNQRVAALDDELRRLVMVVIGTTIAVIVLALGLGALIASRISRRLTEAVAGMSVSTAQIAATVDEHERTVTQQAAAVNETTSTVEELGASSRQSASQAEATVAAARRALDISRDGTRLANQVSASMGGMKEKVGSVTEQILKLSEQAGQIGSIAKVVGELASETNMLALNAAVEAARAGEHGKGFAVVAAEVRKLADQSKKSAERANALVADIQRATNSAVMVTEDSNHTAEEVVAMTQKTLEAFDEIAGAAGSVSESAQQVLLNSRQQAIALEQVTEAMKNLASGSQQISIGTQQTQLGVQKLNDVAQGIKALV